MSDVTISYETLFELLRLERSRTELQKLPEEFIEDSVNYIRSEKTLLESSSDLERKRKEIHLKNIVKILNELYERREKKVVIMALDKSKTKSAIIDFSKLLQHERKLFDEVLSVLNVKREWIDEVLLNEGEISKNESSVSAKIDSNNGDENDNMDSVNLKEDSNGLVGNNIQDNRQEDRQDSARGETTHQVNNQENDDSVSQSDSDISNVSSSDDAVSSKKSEIVRFLSPFPSFLGEELEEYGPFDEEDVASLPFRIAELLINKEKAEKIIPGN